MRILGFSKRWQKLEQDSFTTFRFKRRDRDWEVGEVAQIVYKPRSKDREVLGIAEIISKEAKNMDLWYPKNQLKQYNPLSDEEAKADGFEDAKDMLTWLWKVYKDRPFEEPMNKLTLVWRSLC